MFTSAIHMKKKSTTLGSILVLALIVAVYLFIPSSNTNEPAKNTQTQSQVEVLEETKVQQSTIKHQIADVDLADPPRFEKIAVDDIRSVDGDTFAFRSRGKNFKLRLLMVDTPESVKEDTPVMPFGKEASEFTAAQLEKGQVSLVFDKGSVKDKYDRYLAYVYVGDDLLQNLLLENGLGIVRYVDAGGDSYLQELLTAQKIAEDQKIGVWSRKDYVYKTKTSYYRFNEDTN